ncbi:MAG: RNA polymerase sigma factor [Cytophagales bacterium]|nr:RNA polymerase sigma factor [Bernardetiaceae bacterium]MDW8209867.1 RNA polymerase sigma factor [Cytophagales bacterium]
MKEKVKNWSEEELITRCARGERKAQQVLYERFCRKMYVVALRYSKTTFEAEDILQESFIKVFAAIGSFKGDSTLEYWIKRIVINTALKHTRKLLDKTPMEDVDEINEEPFSYISADESYDFKELLEVIRKLSPGYQAVFNLYAIEGYKHHEIAEMLGISEGTSKSQYARAKALIQKMLAREEEKAYAKQRENL